MEDRSAASSPEDRDPGLFLLRKDSERRAILYKILWEEQNQVASNLQECVAQVQAGRGGCNPTPSAQGRVPGEVQMGLPPPNICSYNNHHKYFPTSSFPTKENTKKTET